MVWNRKRKVNRHPIGEYISMNRDNRTRKILVVIVAMVMLAGILAIYPVRRIAVYPYESNYGKGEVWGSGDITAGKKVSQDFQAKRGYLKRISIYMQNLQEEVSGDLIITIRRGEKILTNCRVSLESIENYEWHPVVLDTWLQKDDVYTLEMTADAPENGLVQTFVTTVENGPEENRKFCYNNGSQEAVLALNYQYTYPAENLWEAIPFIAMILLAGIIMVEIILQPESGKQKTEEGK